MKHYREPLSLPATCMCWDCLVKQKVPAERRNQVWLGRLKEGNQSHGLSGYIMTPPLFFCPLYCLSLSLSLSIPLFLSLCFSPSLSLKPLPAGSLESQSLTVLLCHLALFTWWEWPLAVIMVIAMMMIIIASVFGIIAVRPLSGYLM